jgi:cation diffusion facilitator family transporter
MPAAEATAPVCQVHVPPAPAQGEARARWVTGLTFAMMVLELVVGRWSRSLALTADGWHMATHVGALGMAAFAYWYARTRAHQTQFAFGTGKVFALAGYTSAGLLLLVPAGMVFEAARRLVEPEAVDFQDAFPVAVLGLLVNLVSAWLLDLKPARTQAAHEHDHPHAHGPVHAHPHAHDANLRAAYLHVVADALTSVAAIAALVAGRYLGWGWFDPLVAILGAVVIARWGLGLLRECARQLIDLDPSTALQDRVRASLEGLPGTRVDDLHLWRVGPEQLVCVVAVSSPRPLSVAEYKAQVLAAVPVDHLTIEVTTAGLAATG